DRERHRRTVLVDAERPDEPRRHAEILRMGREEIDVVVVAGRTIGQRRIGQLGGAANLVHRRELTKPNGGRTPMNLVELRDRQMTRLRVAPGVATGTISPDRITPDNPRPRP